ncbi:MAG TPA: hypothetical protein VFS00_31395, partial [Polyangiaceae bacterium]|nr:hypothetical protein [Polyangiaceae bacterium]
REGEDERISVMLRLIAPPAPTPVHEAPIFAPLLARARAALGLAAGAEGTSLSRDERLDARHGHRTLRELLFVAGREAAYARYPRLAALARGRPAHEIALLLLAARKATDPAFAPPPPLEAEVRAAAARLALTLGPDVGEALAQAFEGAGALRISAWRDAVVLTGVRAGLLLAGDLRAAMRVLDAEPPPGGDLTAAKQMGDLAAFAASANYVALRARLGLAVGTGADEP